MNMNKYLYIYIYIYKYLFIFWSLEIMDAISIRDSVPAEMSQPIFPDYEWFTRSSDPGLCIPIVALESGNHTVTLKIDYVGYFTKSAVKRGV